MAKKKTKKPSFEDLTYEKLVELWCIENIPDSIIAERYNTERSKVTYLRKNKFNIKQYNIFEHIGKVKGIDHSIREEANAIVAYAFRNGFLEDLHAGKHSKLLENNECSRITQEEMKKLMIEACDKVEELLTKKLRNKDQYKLFIKSYHDMYCSEWKK